MPTPEYAQGGALTLHDQMMDAVRQPVRFCDVEASSWLGGHTFERFQLGDFVLQLLLETAEFRNRAMSYRNFNVAAGAWALSGRRYGRMLGYNVKIDDTDAVNIHAEDLVVQKAQDADLARIAVLTVIGPTQEDHASGARFRTLHPCGRCRGRLSDSPLLSNDTLVVTAVPDFTVIQCATLPEIIAAHEEGSDDKLMTFTFEKTPAVLEPRDWDALQSSTSWMVDDLDSSDYDSTVGNYLVQRYIQTNGK